MTPEYLVIYKTPDGDIRIYQMTREELLHSLRGEAGLPIPPDQCVGTLPHQSPQYWGFKENYLIIKGKIVAPKTVASVSIE